MSHWLDIETAPLDEDVIIGWWQEWPIAEWRTAIGYAGSKSGRWLSSQATHWLPLTALPLAPQVPPQRLGETKDGTEERR